MDTLTVDNGVDITTLEPAIRYQYKDYLGSATLETDENGDVISYEEYHPFGSSAYRVEKSGTNLSLKRYRFTNKERDDETGLYYFGVRYYAAWLGRWTSADPGGLVDGLNLYCYVRNNPVNGVDRKGYNTELPSSNNTVEPIIHTGGYRIDFIQYSVSLSNKSGGLEGYSQGINSGGMMYTITPTQDKGLTFFYNTSVTTDKGTTITGHQFYPYEHDAIVNTGTTSSCDPFLGVVCWDDSDLVALAKLAPDELVNFLGEQDSYFASNLSVLKSTYSAYDKASAAIQTADMLAGFASLGKNMLKGSVRTFGRSAPSEAATRSYGRVSAVVPSNGGLSGKINDVDLDPKTGKAMTGKMQSRYKKVLGDNVSLEDIELHHIIPEELATHHVVVSGSNAGFDIQSLNNGIALPKYSTTRNLENGVHASHPQLNTYVTAKLDKIQKLNLDDAGNAKALQELRNELVNEIEILMINAGPGLDNRINEYFRNKKG